MENSEHSTTPDGRLSSMTCPLCREEAPEPFLTLERVPVFCGVLHPSEAAARAAPRSDIKLVLCPKCTLIYNVAFDPTLVEYSVGYENPLHFSAHFRAYAEELSRRLVTDYDLAGGIAVEIGCGDGFFLERLLENGMREAIGYDPSMQGRVVQQRQVPPLRIVPELFERHHLAGPTDAIVCRHVLEHLASPASFLASIRAMIGDRAPLVYFEVPNVEWILKTLSLWDVIYEHFTYWAPATLRALFTRSAFTPLRVSIGFADQFLMLEARPSPSTSGEWPASDEIRRLFHLCSRFATECDELVAYQRLALRHLKVKRATVVLWGAGSKGVTFANVIAGEEPLLAGIVDVNPNKQGKYVGGCGLRVLAPEELKDLRPDVVLLMNENYTAEVSARLDELGFKSEVRHAGAQVRRARS